MILKLLIRLIHHQYAQKAGVKLLSDRLLSGVPSVYINHADTAKC